MRRLVAPAADAPVEPGHKPSFSVVIPAYESAAFVAGAVESALAQTLEPYEVIVCDDGSTDPIATALAPFRDRICFLRRPHRGPGAARNDALRVASGEFIVMLDADDRYEPDRLRALGELAAARPDLDILGTDAYFEFDTGIGGRFYEFTSFAVEEQRLAILEGCFVAWPALRRTRVLEVGGFDESAEIAPAEDWDLFVRLILSGSMAGLVDEPLMRYRKRPSTLTADRARALRARVAVLEKTRLNHAVTVDEHRFLDRCLARAKSRSILTDAIAATSTSAAVGRRRRRRLLALAVVGEVPSMTRLVLAGAAVAPGAAAARMLGRAERRVARRRPRRE